MLNKNIKILMLVTFFCVEIIQAQNSYPIILVHGFMGWGRDEMGSYRY